ncbi:hypothetical protein ACW0JT_02665 [Arthrobacter sp. SA17]
MKAKDKSFRVYTLITLLLILAGVVFNAFMSARGESYTLAVTAEQGSAVVSLANESGRADGGNVSFASQTTGSSEAALDLVRRGEADVALLQEEGSWTVRGRTRYRLSCYSTSNNRFGPMYWTPTRLRPEPPASNC